MTRPHAQMDSGFIRLTIVVFTLAVLIGWVLGVNQPNAEAEDQPASAFSRDVIDFGIVVSDLDKSLKFYTEVIGLTRAGEFTVPAQAANDAGLTHVENPIRILMLKTSSTDQATTVKLMQFTDAKPKAADQRYIHSTLGMSYMTIRVTDMGQALARAAKHGHKPLAKGPVKLGEGPTHLTLLKDPDGNFVELVGPKK